LERDAIPELHREPWANPGSLDEELELCCHIKPLCQNVEITLQHIGGLDSRVVICGNAAGEAVAVRIHRVCP